MKERTAISEDITIVLSESGCVSIYSRMDDVSIHLNDEEQRVIFEWLKVYLGRNEP
jgi:hypothetical protein